MPNGKSMSMFRNRDDFRIDQLRFALCEVMSEATKTGYTPEQRLQQIMEISDRALIRDGKLEG